MRRVLCADAHLDGGAVDLRLEGRQVGGQVAALGALRQKQQCGAAGGRAGRAGRRLSVQRLAVSGRPQGSIRCRQGKWRRHALACSSNCQATRSTPVIISVMPCSTCSRVLTCGAVRVPSRGGWGEECVREWSTRKMRVEQSGTNTYTVQQEGARRHCPPPPPHHTHTGRHAGMQAPEGTPPGSRTRRWHRPRCTPPCRRSCRAGRQAGRREWGGEGKAGGMNERWGAAQNMIEG